MSKIMKNNIDLSKIRKYHKNCFTVNVDFDWEFKQKTQKDKNVN